VRDFWRGEPAAVAEFASRLTGSSDLYQSDGRRPIASVNFVTAHDGFTLRDLVSYNDKHNESNGEDNRDGESHNRSWNCGAEGETDDQEVNTLRARQQRNLITTLLLSQGVPMLAHGDEFGRTQQGNNNAYCQDNELSWVDWDGAASEEGLQDFVRRVLQVRAEHPVFRRRRFFRGAPLPGGEPDALPDVVWLTPAAQEMTEQDWQTGFARSLSVFLNGEAIAEPDERGEPVTGCSFLLLFNAYHESLDFTLPPARFGDLWETELDTAAPLLGQRPRLKPEETTTLEGRSMVVLRRS
jgi:glycogen operon protein